ncbi:hypothetical protein KSS87_018332 [Heliosperma pusillum]|nr:hypothetical protein KSS87_018332 [Heliosperma pusillum]
MMVELQIKKIRKLQVLIHIFKLFNRCVYYVIYSFKVLDEFM